jgi:hypothetical protein
MPRGRPTGSGSGSGTPDIALLISQQIAAAIPTIVVQASDSLRGAGTLGGNGGGNRGTGSGTNGGINGGTNGDGRRGYSYKSFMACKPKDFCGNEGVVGALR